MLETQILHVLCVLAALFISYGIAGGVDDFVKWLLS